MKDFTGVVVAAGAASRFGGPVAKQFLDLAGRPMLEWSVRALAGVDGLEGVIVVLPEDDAGGRAGRRIRNWPGVLAVVPGGATRAASVLAGLRAVRDTPFVLVHDAARPLASRGLASLVAAATREHGAAAPVLAVSDTVKALERPGWIQATLDRSRIGLAQTPQGSRADWLRSALARAASEGFEPTDEASALERAGHRVAAVPGEPDNRKITQVADLREVSRLLGGPPVGLRIGSGYDVHRFGGERPLVLGGIRFDGEVGLIAHSDGDVVLHAAMDALLGAAGEGDIGLHFPPDDERYRGIASTELARRVARRIARLGYELVNLDLTLLAERPKIADRIDPMRRAVARCLGVDPGQVGLKATTLEGLGALGRGEGIACHAVALLLRAVPGDPAG